MKKLIDKLKSFHSLSLKMALVLLTTAVTGCTPENETTTLNVSFTPDMTIPATHGVTYEVETFSDVVYPDLQSELEDNQSDTSLITSLEADNVQININSPSEANFDFVKDMALYLEASGLPLIKIAELKGVPTDLSTIQLELTEAAADLEVYLKKSSVVFNLKYTSDEFAGTDLETTLLVSMSVKAETTNP